MMKVLNCDIDVYVDIQIVIIYEKMKNFRSKSNKEKKFDELFCVPFKSIVKLSVGNEAIDDITMRR